jgi:hypothetical protein
LSCDFPRCGILSRRLLQRCRLPFGVAAFNLQSRGLLSRRRHLLRLPLLLLLGTIELSLFNGALPRLLVDPRRRCFVSASNWGRRCLRARGARRWRDGGRRRRWSGGRGLRGLVGWLQCDHG